MPGRAPVSALLLFLTAAAPSGQRMTMTMNMGWGAESCAKWVNSLPDVHVQGRQWILGFMTGVNTTQNYAQVGTKTDIEGIVGEVDLICRNNPSMLLLEASIAGFRKLVREGR